MALGLGFGKLEVSRFVKNGENVVDFAVNYDFASSDYC